MQLSSPMLESLGELPLIKNFLVSLPSTLNFYQTVLLNFILHSMKDHKMMTNENDVSWLLIQDL
jgi:hypothetical protein